MRIGILAPFNPSALSSYLDDKYRVDVQTINVSASSVNNVVKSLVDSGHEVWVFTVGSYKMQYNGERLHVHVVEGARWNRIFPDLRKLASKIRHELDNYVSGLDVLHAHWCYEYALAASVYSNNKPVFCTIRDWAPVIYSQISIRKRLRNILFKVYWKYKIKIFQAVLSERSIHFIANSEYTAELFRQEYPDREINIIYNSIEDEIIVPKPVIHDKYFISIAMSLDDGRKNIKTLLRAFSKLGKEFEDYRLILIGNYHPSGDAYKFANELGVSDKIVFTGIKTRTEIISLIDKSFCMVHPAFEETFGNILIEAMARGVIVIGGTHSGAVPYVLQHGEAGVLCDVNYAEEIRDAMVKVIKDKDYRDNIVKNALKKVSEFSNSNIAEKHWNLYSSVMK